MVDKAIHLLQDGILGRTHNLTDWHRIRFPHQRCLVLASSKPVHSPVTSSRQSGSDLASAYECQLRGRSAGTSSSLQRYPAPTGFTSSQSITLSDKSIECMTYTWRPSSQAVSLELRLTFLASFSISVNVPTAELTRFVHQVVQNVARSLRTEHWAHEVTVPALLTAFTTRSFLEQQEDAVRTAHPALEGSLRRLPSLLPVAITFTWSPSRSLRLLHGDHPVLDDAPAAGTDKATSSSLERSSPTRLIFGHLRMTHDLRAIDVSALLSGVPTKRSVRCNPHSRGPIQGGSHAPSC